MNESQIGYLVVGAVVTIVLYRRWKASGGVTAVVRHQSTLWGFPGHAWVTTRPVTMVVEKARSKARGWAVVIAAVVTLYATLSH